MQIENIVNSNIKSNDDVVNNNIKSNDDGCSGGHPILPKFTAYRDPNLPTYPEIF